MDRHKESPPTASAACTASAASAASAAKPRLHAVRSFSTVKHFLDNRLHASRTALVLDIDYTVLVSSGTAVWCAPAACHGALMDVIARAAIVVFVTGRPGAAQGHPYNVHTTLRELLRVNIVAGEQHVVFVGHVHKGPTVAQWLRDHVPATYDVLFVDDNLDCIVSVSEAVPHVHPMLFCGDLATPAAQVCTSGSRRVHLGPYPTVRQ